MTARAYIAELAEVLGRPLHFHPGYLWKMQTVELTKWLIKRAGGDNVPLPSARDLRSRGLRARFDTSETQQALSWRPTADRANARLQYFSLDGKPESIVGNVSFPAHFDIRGEILLIPDLHARISLFDKDNNVLAHLGYDPEWTKQVLDGFKMREQPERWENGKFIHPHDACFDPQGNIYVVEWVATGRVSFLKKVA